MIRDAAAKRYAEAAYLVAKEDGMQDQWIEGLTTMAVLAANPDAESVIENVRVPPSEKLALVERSLEGAHPLVMNLARLLLRRNKLRLAPQIKEAFQEMMDESKGIYHARVTTAVPLSSDELREVTDKLAKLTGGRVVASTEVDESILGGLVVRIGDRLIDGSTRSRLIELRRQLRRPSDRRPSTGSRQGG